MAETVTMPKLGFDMAEGTLVRWVIQENEPVAKGQILAEIETDKATVEVESNFDGILARHLVKAGDVVPVNTPIAIVAAPGESVEPAPTPAQAAVPVKPAAPEPVAAATSPVDAAQAVSSSDMPGGVIASPVARRMAHDFKINLAAVKGSGPGGRIVRKDIEAYLSAPAVAAATLPVAASTAPAPAQLPSALPPWRRLFPLRQPPQTRLSRSTACAPLSAGVWWKRSSKCRISTSPTNMTCLL